MKKKKLLMMTLVYRYFLFILWAQVREAAARLSYGEDATLKEKPRKSFLDIPGPL